MEKEINREYTVTVNNVPEDAERYVVARLICQELWYYCSFSDYDKARECERQFENGIIVSELT